MKSLVSPVDMYLIVLLMYTGNLPLMSIGNDATDVAPGVTGICATVDATGVIGNDASGVAVDITAGDAPGDAQIVRTL